MNDTVMEKVGDLISASVLLGWMAGALPTIATLLTIIWTSIRIYEWWKGRNAKD
jgi:hypothetical protein